MLPKTLFIVLFVELYKQPDRIAVITGGNRGIGLRIVEKLLACDMTVVMGEFQWDWGRGTGSLSYSSNTFVHSKFVM